MRKTEAGEIVQFSPKPAELAAVIRRIATDSGCVGFSDHAVDRMEERGITRLDALRVLRGGDIRGEIKAGRACGEWKCKVVMNLKGSRNIGVVTLVVKMQRLFVKTVEWEDR
ncbi:DUF4258 domain-containing protein [Roseiarcus fermentans]|uniref:DUF4258 domain-containing protein n=1 Tax=Roseiarcus fermentans TaxID=1473586 RepID=UPI000DEBD988|nr:DUF4258 domain-containing protein [Roseiarcus fermentans]